MGDALDLNLFPSCANCLSWSDDGELAIAAGDAVHLQLPQYKPKWVHPLFEKEKSTPWTSAKIRASTFTHREWPVSWPSDRDEFSIGAEQSLATVVGLAWSPQGLGKHRRCVLAVLTSNLLLSLYEADGQRKTWARVAVVNAALQAGTKLEGEEKTATTKKKKEKGMGMGGRRVRAFAWCSPLKIGGRGGAQEDREEGSARWGEQMLAVATDDNQLLLVHVKRDAVASLDQSVYSLTVVSQLSLHRQDKYYPMTPGPSLWADAMEQKAKIRHVACGPWKSPDNSADDFRGMIAVVQGSKLRVVHVQTHIVAGGDANIDDDNSRIAARMSHVPADWLPEPALDRVNFTGPLAWIPSDDRVLLLAGCLGGRAALWCDSSAYLHQNNKPVCRQRSFQEDNGFVSMGQQYHQHNEPMTGIVSTNSDPPKVYITTLGPVSETIALSVIGSPLEDTVAVLKSPWLEHMERYRQRYNIQYELGDMTVVRTWGLASFRGWLAVAFTMHPGDVLEYTIRAEENTVVIFVSPHDNAVFPEPPDVSEEHVVASTERILRFILSSAGQVHKGQRRSARLVYAACMCAVIFVLQRGQQTNPTPSTAEESSLLTLAHNALTHISATFDIPLSDELVSYCTNPAQLLTMDTTTETTPSIIPAQPPFLLQSPSGWLFEICQTCYRRRNEHVGLNWTGHQMAICANGHRWNRCSLTFLAIQEPYISRSCSVCDMNCLAWGRGVDYTLDTSASSASNGEDEDMREIKGETDIDNDQQQHQVLILEERDKAKELYDRLYDRYDVCAYCGGKYQDE